MKSKIKIDAELDDKAFYIGDFIHELHKVQDQKFEELWAEAKANNWIEGMSEADAKEWLFDYCFNGHDHETGQYEHMFCEFLPESMFDIESTV